jgi:hypothetical protein
LSGAGSDETSEEVCTGAGAGVPAGTASGAGSLSGAELVVGGALLLVVVTGEGRSVPVWVLPGRGVGSVLVVVSVPEWAFVSVPVLPSTPESEFGETSVPCVVSVVTELSSGVVFSGRPVVVVRGLPPEFEDVPEPAAGPPELVPLWVGTPDPVVFVPVLGPVPALGGTTLVLGPLATGTSAEDTGVEVPRVSGLPC